MKEANISESDITSNYKIYNSQYNKSLNQILFSILFIEI